MQVVCVYGAKIKQRVDKRNYIVIYITNINTKQLTMDGYKVKKLIAGNGYTIADVAEKIGTSRQNLSKSLSSQDVKSGLLEKISHALNIPVSYFYGEESTGGVISHHNQVNGEGAYGNINGDGGADTTLLQERVKALQTLLEEKERTIKILMEKRVN